MLTLQVEHPKIYAQTDSGKIEVHPESMELALSHIAGTIKAEHLQTKDWDISEFSDGLYQVPLRVNRTEYACKDDGFDGYAVQCKGCDCRKYAILE